MLRISLTVWMALCVLAPEAKAQVTGSPMNAIHNALLQAHFDRSKENINTAFAPYLTDMHVVDSVCDADTRNWQRREHQAWVMKKLRNEHLFQVRTENFSLNGDATFHLEYDRGLTTTGKPLFVNTRGYQFSGTLGQRWFFNTSFHESQGNFPAYMDSVLTRRGDFNTALDFERGSMPGHGRMKPFNTQDYYAYDYPFATGTIGVKLKEQGFAQFGTDKQFLGYGHRSLFLSDAATPYTFVRFQWSFFKNRLTYSTTWAVLQSLEKVNSFQKTEQLLRRSGGRFSYLHFQPVPWLGIGWFDGTIWEWRKNHSAKSVEYYLPHAGLYTGTGLTGHITGLNGFLLPVKFTRLYGQFGLNLTTGGRALQMGLRLQGLPENLFVTLEWNKISGNFYHFVPNSDTSNGWINEPFAIGSANQYYQNGDLILGHPMGVGLSELIVKVQYRLRDLFVQVSVQQCRQNIPLTPRDIRFVNLEAGYIINPRSNAMLVAGIIYREESNMNSLALNQTTFFPYVAFKTSLFNRFLDF